MSIRNRELSQFGSFIYIDDSTKTVGIATTATPYVGIGTTNATHKLTVIGDANISGATSATNLTSQQLNVSGVSTLGVTSATNLTSQQLNVSGVSTLGVTSATNLTSQQLNVSGVSTLGVTSATNLTSQQLNVSGNTNVGGALSATSYYLNGSSLVNAVLQTWDLAGSDIYRANGNVGIGTSVISEKLEVIGNAKASRFISTVTTGTSPFTINSQTLVTNLNADYLRGKTPPGGDLVGTTDTQTLTNKTLTLPTFSSTGVAFTGSTSGVTTVRASATATGIVEIPSVTGIQTFVATGAVGVVTSGMIADLSIVNDDVATGAGITYGKLNLSNSIVNADIASGAAIAVSKLASSTISGISLGSNLNDLTAGSFINYSSGSTYNGSTAITVSVAATTANTANTVIARNASGDFSAGSISCADVNATFNLQGDTLVVTKISAGSTVGTAGSVLASTGTGLEWKNIGGFSVTDDITTDLTYYPVFVNATSGIPSQTSVSSTNLQFNPLTGTLSATIFTSLSDKTQKTNIRPIENSIELVKQLEGVRYDWINNDKPSIGVIAQDIEKVIPEVVETNSNGLKSVSYGNIVGVLIEAIKEQQVRIEELERKLNV